MALETTDEATYGNPPGSPLCGHAEGSKRTEPSDWTHVEVSGTHYYKCSCGTLSLCPVQPFTAVATVEPDGTTPAVTPPETLPQGEPQTITAADVGVLTVPA